MQDPGWTLRQLQGQIRSLYGAKDSQRGTDGTFMWFMEEVGELAAALRSGSREELHSVVLPPGAFCVGKSLADLSLDRSNVTVTAIRREGIVGPQPEPSTVFREGDVVVLHGTPEALQHGEARLLMG